MLNSAMREPLLPLYFFTHLSLFYLIVISPSLAQVIPDNTLTNPTVVNQNSSTAIITGGTEAGSNLFHSFSDFSIPNGGKASFQHDTGIANILSRVTGVFPSKIDGLIEILQNNGAASSANLFLINPNGIFFGKDAALNIGGSFIASTANSIKLSNGGEFSTINPTNNQTLLTVSVPTGLQFGINSGEIINQSISSNVGLSVKPSKTLALVGGNVELPGGYLTALNGKIELGSVASPGLVNVNSTDTGFSLGYTGIQEFGNIRLSQGSRVNISGNTGGDAAVNSRNMKIEDGSLMVSTISGKGNGGNITINVSENVELFGSSSILFSQLANNASGKGTNLLIFANKLLIKDGAILFSDNRAAGVGGNIIIKTKFIESAGSNTGILTNTRSTGQAGNINVETQQLSLQEGAQISSNTLGLGQGGYININAKDSLTATGISNTGNRSSGIFAQTFGKAFAGELAIKTNQLRLFNGAQISSITFADGAAGKILVEADSIELSGIALKGSGEVVSRQNNPVVNSGILASSDRNSSGNAAPLTIKTNSLNMRDGAIIQTSTLGSGDAGNLTINAKNISLSGTSKNGLFPTAILSASGGVTGGDFIGFPEATGKSGSLSITTDKLTVENQAQIAVSSLNSTNAAKGAGNLDITAANITLSDGGKLNAQSNSGNGGDITLNLQKLLILRGNSSISATAGTADKPGDGGNININAKDGFIVAFPGENSDITANAFTGNGGNIKINARTIFNLAVGNSSEINKTNDIDASSKFGQAGLIVVNTPDVDPSRGLLELPTGLTDASQQIASNCNPGNTARRNSFTATGRGGIAPSPVEPLQGDVETGRWVTLNTFSSSTSSQFHIPIDIPTVSHSQTPIIEAQGWVRDKNGDINLVAQAANITSSGFSSNSIACQILPK
ncbi:MAG: S-layer family protein [Calothrix sp. CSU_2_0]|nr:S-layer family protein [Calothrix sp. CSU_2_0]